MMNAWSKATSLLGPLLALALSLSACGAMSTVGGLRPTVQVQETTVVVQAQLGAAWRTQAVAHRWLTSEIKHYRVALFVWDGADYPQQPTLSVNVVPSDGQQSAEFKHLKQGLKYRIAVEAISTTDVVMNKVAPTTWEIDLTGSQDVPSMLSKTLTVNLDSTPFSGSLTLNPVAPTVPATTTQYRYTLTAPEGMVTSGVYPVSKALTLSNLKVGKSYQAQLEALSSNGTVNASKAVAISFNPQGQDIEQAVVSNLAFPLPVAASFDHARAAEAFQIGRGGYMPRGYYRFVMMDLGNADRDLYLYYPSGELAGMQRLPSHSPAVTFSLGNGSLTFYPLFTLGYGWANYHNTLPGNYTFYVNVVHGS